MPSIDFMKKTAAGFAAACLVLGGGLSLAAHGKDQHADRAWMGVMFQPAEDGVLVVKVFKKDPADLAGLKEGDVITDLDGHPIDTTSDFLRAFDDLKPGDHVTATVRRKGEAFDIDVTLVDRKDAHAAFPARMVFPALQRFRSHMAGPEMRQRGYLGVEAQTMTDELREYFGAPDGAGILVARVEDGSPAEKAGLLVGDVITEADGEPIDSVPDLVRVLRDKKEGDPVDLTYYRGGRRGSLEALAGVTEHRVWELHSLAECGDEDDDDCGSRFNVFLDPEDLPSGSSGGWGTSLGMDPGFSEGMKRLQEYLGSPEFHQQIQRSIQIEKQLQEKSEELEKRLEELERRLQAMPKENGETHRRGAGRSAHRRNLA
ncbi:MAG: PDZ domain-containing protein [Acidobacteriota bacterium]